MNTETLVTDVILSKHPNCTSPALEAFHPYVSSPALIDLEITSNIVDWVPKTMKGAAGPWFIGTVNWQDWTLHYGPSSREFQEFIATLVWWLANTYPPWEAYRSIVASRLTVLDNCPGVRLVIIRDILLRILGNCVLKSCGKDVTHTCGVQLSFTLVIFLPWISTSLLIRDMVRCLILGKASVDRNEVVCLSICWAGLRGPIACSLLGGGIPTQNSGYGGTRLCTS